jgi:hypothetical protein
MSSSLCPNCNSVLSTNEITEGWCEGCGKKVPSSAITSPRANPSSLAFAEPRLRLTSRSGDRLGWGTARAGLGVMAAGTALLTVGLLGFVLVNLAGSESRGPSRPSTFLQILGILNGALLVIGAAQLLTGMCMGCAVPESSGARGVVVGATVCLGLGILVLLFTMMASIENAQVMIENMSRSSSYADPGRMERLAPEKPLPYSEGFLKGVWVVYGIMALATSSCFLGFLLRLATHFNRSGLAVSITLFLIINFCLNVLSLALQFSDGPIKWLAKGGMGLAYLALAVAVLVLAWFGGLVCAVRRSITATLLD